MSRIDEIKEQLAEENYDCWFTSAMRNDVHDTSASDAIKYLLSKLEDAEKALDKIKSIYVNVSNSHEASEKMMIRAREALQQLRS